MLPNKIPLLCLALAATTADAQDTTVPNESEVLELAPYVVSANRFDELSDNIPVNIELITSEDIELSGASNLVEVLEKEAQVYFRSVSGNASQAEIDLRGFGENSGVRTLVIVDGVKLNRPDIGSLNWLQIPLQDIESIQVMRGTQTALYGNNAVGGVVKITTKRGTKPFSAQLSSSGGNYELINVGGSVSGKNDKIDYLAGGYYNHFDGYRDNSSYTSTSANFNLGYYPNEDLSFKLSGAWNQTDSLFPGGLTLAQANDDPQQSLTNPENSYSHEKIYRIDGKATYAFSDESRFELTAGYLHRSLDWSLEGPGANNLIQTVIASPKQILEWGPWKWVFGIDYIFDSLEFNIFQNNDHSNATEIGKLTRNSIGAYAHSQYQWSPKGIASAGFRIEGTQLQGNNSDQQAPFQDFDGTKNDGGFAFDLGLVYKYTPELRFWGRASRLYRYPATDEIAAYQGFPLAEPFNFSLNPETGYDVEIGVDWIDAPFFANANLFGMWIDGEIGFDFNQSLNTNIGNSQRLGAELAVGILPQPVGISVNYHYIDARWESGLLSDQIIWLVPKHRVYIRAEWRIIKELAFITSYEFVSDQRQGNDINNTLPNLPSYNLLNFMLRYKFTDWGECFIAMDNATDTQYFSVAFSGIYYPANGRTYKGGVNLRF